MDLRPHLRPHSGISILVYLFISYFHLYLFSIPHTKEFNLIDKVQLFITEMHVNDARSPTPFYAFDYEKFLESMKDSNQGLKILLIDITANCLSDKVFSDLIKAAQYLVDSGKLILILVQSMTKFSSLGVDIAPGGLLMIFSRKNIEDCSNMFPKAKEFLLSLNKRCESSCATKKLQRFFEFCLSKPMVNLQKEYLSLIRVNTHQFQDKILILS